MSASTSCSVLLARLRGWDDEPTLDEVREMGDKYPDAFFRYVVEPLSDSFSARDVKVYERMMRAWIPAEKRAQATPPSRTEHVHVLSRVTLGSDIKITSVLLDAAKKRYPEARIVFVGNAKCAELFAEDRRVIWERADYPRTGSIEARLDFLRKLYLPEGIVIDPDSRFTQLGLALPCESSRYFHFPSRTYRHGSEAGLSALASRWMEETFGVAGRPYLRVAEAHVEPRSIAVSLGVGGNETKRIAGSFEADLLTKLARLYECIYIDRGAGGDERDRVDAAVSKAGIHPRYCDGSFAEFAATIAKCDAYCGYDSAGQHAAAALGVPLTTIFKGAANATFRARWTPEGTASVRCIDADSLTPEEVLRAID